MSIIFGPILSRRFGKSLGVDLSPNYKQCNFDCLYCELLPGKKIENFEDIILPQKVIEEIKQALKKYPEIDVLTFTANGEPTLYPFLDKVIDEVNLFKGDIKTLILSNASKIFEKKIQNALKKFDIVKLSLDCFSKECFKKLDRALNLDIDKIKKGIKEFALEFDGEVIIEILVVKGINDKEEEIQKIANFLKEINPKRVDLGTIDRPPAYDVKEVEFEDLLKLSLLFPEEININIVTKAKEKSKKKFHFTQEQILETLKRRPLKLNDVEILFDQQSKKNLKELLEEKKIVLKKQGEEEFFISQKN
jgi:wyosine [tRNA(Phe)-imidazoG37] synthetase (radical SAM superfamily)